MNCRDTQLLLQAEKDGALGEDRRAALARHLEACPACREFRDRLSRVGELVRADAAGVKVPDADAEWRRLRAQIRGEEVPLPRKRRLAPVYWLGAPIAAAAALALAFFVTQPASPEPAGNLASAPSPAASPGPAVAAAADYVEAGDPDASTLVYVDKESGWLVVWAARPGGATNG